MIQTVDFFTPIVDDPYTFGEIAAANALSDVFAMGGDPKVALNIAGFPNCLDPSILGEILAGGAAKTKEAGAVLIGGHTIQNDEPLYGLCVSGFVHPERIWKNYGAKPGDVLILTKQIGSGIVATAAKADMASRESMQEAELVMKSLNRKAKEAMMGLPIHACTDITGFGLAGHCFEMAEASRVCFELSLRRIPMIEDAIRYADMGLIPAGAYKNRGYSGDKVDTAGVAQHYIDLIYDPQSSGGLLFSIPAELEEEALRRLGSCGLDTRAAAIGYVLPEQEKRIRLR